MFTIETWSETAVAIRPAYSSPSSHADTSYHSWPHIIELPSDPSRVRDCRHKMMEICSDYHMPKRAIDDVILAAGEAMINAQAHGNRLDPGKYVRIYLQSTPNGEMSSLSVCIEDESSVRKPEYDGGGYGSEVEHGRGNLMMRILMDCVEEDFFGRPVDGRYVGNVIRMRKEYRADAD